MDLKAIAILEGDQTGQELLEESLRVLAPDVTGLKVDLPRFDLSLAARRRTGSSTTRRPRFGSMGSASRRRP